jgi:cell division protein FtsA
MAYTNFFAAIDLGSTHIVGIVGTRNANGLSILAYEMEDSENCIRRGSIYNVKETANKIKRLVLKLENKLNGSKIGKVYVGVGGQSIRSVNHKVSKVFADTSDVTDEAVDALDKECFEFRPDLLSVLDVVSPTYYLDDKIEPNPVGVACKRIEACYKLIVGRPSLQQNINNSIKEQARIDVAGVLVSPLALADVVLNDNEKELGCALVNFGGGVTSVTIFKGGKLVDLCVIPLGSNLITKDIMDLNIVEKEAERIKINYARATVDRENDPTIMVEKPDGMGMKEIKQSELNQIVQARVNEILENVYYRIEKSNVQLGAGIVLAGGGSSLKYLSDVIRDHTKKDVRFATIRNDVMEKGDVVAGNPIYLVAVGLLAQSVENCAAHIEGKPFEHERKTIIDVAKAFAREGELKKEEPAPHVEIKQEKVEKPEKQEPVVKPENPEKEVKPEKPEKPEKKKSAHVFKRFIDNFGRTLFDEPEEKEENNKEPKK